MSFQPPNLLALDFDGVICDGLLEYFATTKQTYQQIWSNDRFIDEDLASSFYQLRPVIETGWEMPILLRALVLGISKTEIFNDWSAIASKIIVRESLDKKNLARKLDGVRDVWINNNLEQWLGLHRFYPGVIDRLKQILNSTTELYIVTTKEGRFVKQLLEQQGIELASDKIIGKEFQRPKYETLRLLRDKAGNNLSIWFVEDRLRALEQVRKQPDLSSVNLFLADWGYNIERDRLSIQRDRYIQLLSLSQFTADFLNWQVNSNQ
jgi:phosphoglycolate phosphatase-like HAD superfamily hydrolase